MFMDAPKFQTGYFSERCTELFGSVYWADDTGREFEVNFVSEKDAEPPEWEDGVCVSHRLVSYVREGRYGTFRNSFSKDKSGSMREL
jgi:hypothetical protein